MRSTKRATDKIVKSKPKYRFCAEAAKSGRSVCRTCDESIDKGNIRIGVVRFTPHRTCQWHHLGCSHDLCEAEDIWGFKKLDDAHKQLVADHLTKTREVVVSRAMTTVTGELDMPRFADALSERYGKFRSFRFGLPEREKYSKNWNWRCFLATMLVCNTHERAMLKVVGQLFRVYETPEQLDELRGDKEAQKAWKDWMESRDLRHAGKKMFFILNANRAIMEEHDGEVPDSRDQLMELPGVGRHVSSVTMAWVHNAPEFGVDVHVRRIMERWGYIDKDESEHAVEAKVKSVIDKDKIGKFSRAFVDHGQSVCGYTPNCEACHLRYSCPSANGSLDW